MAHHNEPIAIVGSACRFPGSANSQSKLWDLLKQPRDVIRDFPSDRLNLASFYDANSDHHGRTNVQPRGYLLEEDCRLFDASFFRINAKEADALDPQQRLLLETTFEALESAGWPLDQIEGSRTSVHVGSMTSDYEQIQTRDTEAIATYTATGTARSMISNRISYFFDLKGPSITVDTACSSSLVALHQAVQCIRNGEADQSLVAGTSLLLDPSMYVSESNLHMLSPDQRSRMWDKDANGYARGEGCAVVVLKSLSAAIRDNDDIECIIRETGVNSDGRTNGITVPNASAQADLIRQTYARASLDPLTDRCHYFECHGTGTPAGDPIEARAIQEAFFPEGFEPADAGPLYCGSVKTVIGHLEGCAGLAGVLKASLALKNKTIPPNLLFNQLNPAIKPFSKFLRVPTISQPWPETGDQPLRASVNSFGFGGTNAHAILENYRPSKELTDAAAQKELVGPFVFSAKSQKALVGLVRKVTDHIRDDAKLDLDALGWVLHSRRTVFSHRLAVGASSREQLLKSLEQRIDAATAGGAASLGVKTLGAGSSDAPKILGVFTGQGAQWAGMGRDLIKRSPLFQKSLKACEDALSALPNGPSWSLTQELLAEGSASSVSLAEYSQPLCTAIQICLVDLCKAAGIQFAVVVGHSSGEIGAAYAAGILNVRDAMGIAYYRGVATSSPSPEDVKGGMMAVGLSYGDAKAFCSRKEFAGRIGVAASNSPLSSTLSGDLDAIVEAGKIFEEQQTFARALKVEVAYHSHHMLRCADAYAANLEKMNISVQEPRGGCQWYSSVSPHDLSSPETLESLKGSYWVRNMVEPVMFSQAVERVLLDDHEFVLGMEVGPHPALKGPVDQTFNSLSRPNVPYAGCLNRQKGAVESITEALGTVWSHSETSTINFEGWRKAFGLSTHRRMLKNLPSYAWDHDQIYWNESRLSKSCRLTSSKPHNLLGRLHEDCQSEMTWRNILHINEIPWMRGHAFQGQAILPGASYITMAAQAAETFVRGRRISLIEMQDVSIHRAVVISEESDGVEMLFKVRSHDNPSSTPSKSTIEAEFVCYSSMDQRVLEKTCDGKLILHFDDSKAGDFPNGEISKDELPPADVEKFYTRMSEIGIDYDGVFKVVNSINKIWSHAKATASWPSGQLGEDTMVPAPLLDTGFQIGFATSISIAEASNQNAYLPASMKRVVIDPTQTYQGKGKSIELGVDAYLVKSSAAALEVDVTLYNGKTKHTGIRVDGLVLAAIAGNQALEDVSLFAKTVWDIDTFYGLRDLPVIQTTDKELDYIEGVERTALFFLQNVAREILPEEIPSFRDHHQRLFRAVELLLEPVYKGTHPTLKREWLYDDRETIRRFAERYPKSVDIALLTSVGESLPSVVRGQSEMLEHMLKDDMLSRLYTEGRGFRTCNEHAAAFVRQIAHKFPRSDVLEIGAGTGGTTRGVLDALGDSYVSYTYTDLSAGFFENAGELFSSAGSKMKFKTLDIGNDPSGQGYTPNSYDIIVAANVLHATPNLSTTLANVRSLLRPGGYLIAVEVTGIMLREHGLMGGLEGWWLGLDDGRFPSPGIPVQAWDKILREQSFSGVDSVAYDASDIIKHNCSVFVTRATDEQFTRLHDPLSSPKLPSTSDLVIIGGKTTQVSYSVLEAESLLKRQVENVVTFQDIDAVDITKLSNASILYLAELDMPLFSSDVKPETLRKLQTLLSHAKNVLWVTCGRLSHNAYSNMMVGVGRSLMSEMPDVRMQFLDFEKESLLDMETACENLLRLMLLPPNLGDEHKMLGALEPEVIVTDNGLIVPRVVPDRAANEGLSARRQLVSSQVERNESIQVLYESTPPTLIKRGQPKPPQDFVEIDVRLSIALHAAHEKQCFLVSGSIKESSVPVLALAETDCSSVTVMKDRTFELASGSNNGDILAAVGACLIAARVVTDSPPGGTILIHDPEPITGASAAIIEAASRAGRKVLFLTAQAEPERPGHLFVHPLAQKRFIQQVIPDDASVLWCFSATEIDNVIASLPGSCTVQSFDSSTMHHQRQEIAAACEMAFSIKSRVTAPKIKIADISSHLSADTRLSAVIDWQRTGSETALVRPIAAEELFYPDKTYLLVGMTGELGQSLCRFMHSCGARHFVLASRRPVQDAKWVASMRKVGADVQILRMDITDKQQVHRTVQMIKKDMPKIGGVINAAMVLEDGLFANATAEIIERQLKPKVDGTIHLDRELKEDDLDFFILCSSLATVYGNAGQSIYHAANMFMIGFVESRKLRGQVGSVIDVGMVADAGYVARSVRGGSKVSENLRAQFYIPLAETDFHYLVVQAIVAGSKDSSTREVTMGVRPFVDDPKATQRPPWYDNPRFGHMIASPKNDNSQALTASSNQQQQLDKLFKAESFEDACKACQEIFCAKIEAILKIPAASVDIEAPLSNLGLDSLIAVEIRTWLLHKLGVEVSLLSILNQESVLSISHQTAAVYVEPSTSQADMAAVGKSSTTQANTAAVEKSSSLPTVLVVDRGDMSSRPSTIDLRLGITPEVDGSSLTVVSTPDSKDYHSTDNAYPSKELDYESKYSRVERTSYPQSSLRFLSAFLDDPTTFNVTARYDIKGRLDVDRFAQALELTLARHEAFQTCFFTEPGSLGQFQGIVSNEGHSHFTHLHSAEDEDIQRTFANLRDTHWKLDAGHAFQTVLITQKPDLHTALFACHHIIMDGMSWYIFFQDLDRAYKSSSFDTTPASYLDFSKQQISAIEGGLYEDSIKYWVKQFDPLPPVLPLLPFAQKKARQPKHVYQNHIAKRTLSDEAVKQVKKASRLCGATPMNVYLAVVQALFSCFLDEEKICIGISEAGRGLGEFSQTVGHFMNLLPMQFDISRDQSFKDLVRATTRTVLNGLSHAQVPFDVILGKLCLQRSEYTPLFQVAFNYRAGDLLQKEIGDCHMSLIEYEDAKTPYDFTFSVTQAADGSHLLELASDAVLYSKDATEKILDIYVNMVANLCSDHSRRLQDLDTHDDSSMTAVQALGRGPIREYSWPKTLIERFQQVCTESPDSIAIKDSHGFMSYKQLSHRVNAISSALRKASIFTGDRVAVLCEPSIDTFAAMLGILHVGAVYVPLDINLPSARHSMMIESFKPSLLVYHQASTDARTQCDKSGALPCLNLSKLSSSEQEITASSPADVAFLLFTSGSTGKPKGIELKQSGLMNYAAAKGQLLDLEKPKVLQQSSLGFDMSLAQAFNAFCNAGTLVVASSLQRGDPKAIADLMLNESIEFTICTPSEYVLYTTYAQDSLRKNVSWRHACSGGEGVTDALVSNLQRLELPDLVLVDCYGPTEISCAVTIQKISLQSDGGVSELPSSVGRAIPNASVYIVDDNGQVLRPGFPGEICVGGPGVAKGYLDESLSSAKFIRNPFASAEDTLRGWDLMYKTGDKGYLLEDGSLALLGRIDGDTLIKLRGLRIELTEVANAIIHAGHGSIVNAIVTVRGDPEFLVAHLVLADGHSMSQAALDRFCEELPLPRYAIPSMIIPVERLPTTNNGKIDRRAVAELPLPERTADDAADEERLTVPQGELRLLWRETLGKATAVASIGAETDFFRAGGSSLLLVRLQNLVKERMGVQVPIHQLYQQSTLGRMAALLNNERSQISADVIDWAAETTVPKHLLESKHVLSDPKPREKQLHIILTGATGFLGGEILAALLKDDAIERVSCIAVPADARDKLPSDPRVSVYTGSLLSPSLGLSRSEETLLQTSADRIIHAGANGHCLNNFSSVRDANYLSTQYLAGLALPRRIPFDLISSPRVTLQSGSCEAAPVSMAAHPPPTDGSQGFTASKWASECFLEKLSEKTGLPVVIHRSCSVIGDKAPHDDAINSIIRFSILSRKVPDVPSAEGYFDFKDVKSVAAEIASRPDSDNVVSFRHYSSGVKVPFAELAKRMEHLYGGEFAMVKMTDWIAEAIKLGIEDLIVSYLEANVAGAERLIFPFMGTSS